MLTTERYRVLASKLVKEKMNSDGEEEEEPSCVGELMKCCHNCRLPLTKSHLYPFQVKISIDVEENRLFRTGEENVFFRVFLAGPGVISEKRIVQLDEVREEVTWERELREQQWSDFQIRFVYKGRETPQALKLNCGRLQASPSNWTSLCLDIYQHQEDSDGEKVVVRLGYITLNLRMLELNSNMKRKRYKLHNFDLKDDRVDLGDVLIPSFQSKIKWAKGNLGLGLLLDFSQQASVLQRVINREQRFIRGLNYSPGMDEVQIFHVGYRMGEIPRLFYYLDPKSKVAFTREWIHRQVRDAMLEAGVSDQDFLQVKESTEAWHRVLQVGIYALSSYISFCLKYRSDHVDRKGRRPLSVEAFQQDIFETGGFDCEDGAFGFMALWDYFLEQDYSWEEDGRLKILQFILDHYCVVAVLGKAKSARPTDNLRVDHEIKFDGQYDRSYVSWHDYAGVFWKPEFFWRVQGIPREKIDEVVRLTSRHHSRQSHQHTGPFFVELTAPVYPFQRMNLEMPPRLLGEYKRLWGVMKQPGSGLKLRILTEGNYPGAPSIYGRQSYYSYSGFVQNWEGGLDTLLGKDFRTTCFTCQWEPEEGREEVGVPAQLFFYDSFKEKRETFKLIPHPAFQEEELKAFQQVDLFEQPPSLLDVCSQLKEYCPEGVELIPGPELADYPLTVVMNNLGWVTTQEQLNLKVANKLSLLPGQFLATPCFQGNNVLVKIKF